MRPLILFIALGPLALSALPASAAPRDRCLESRFKGITETNPNGDILGRVDRNDWGCIPASELTPPGVTATGGVPVPPLTELCFEPAAPNPAGSATRLLFKLPVASDLKLALYSQTHGSGRPEAIEVRTLFEGAHMPGAYSAEWDLRDGSGALVPPGIYRAVLRVGDVALCGDIEVL